MGTLLQDIRYGLRALTKSPGFTVIAVLALALGIGANTALFSVVDAVLIRPLPFKNASQLVWSWGSCALCSQAAVSPSDFLDYRAQNQSFEHYGAMAAEDSLFNLAGNDKPIQVKGSMVTAGFFDALGIQPRYGRVFEASDEKTTDPEVVILSRHLWQDRFGSDPQVMGNRSPSMTNRALLSASSQATSPCSPKPIFGTRLLIKIRECKTAAPISFVPSVCSSAASRSLKHNLKLTSSPPASQNNIPTRIPDGA